MKCKTVYCCEFCDALPFADMDAARIHEASHFGLTIQLYREWGDLTRAAERAGCQVGIASNPETRKNFDDAIERLCDFEKAHSIPSEIRRPRFW